MYSFPDVLYFSGKQMGNIDALKKFMSNPDISADIFSHLICDGRKVIKPEELH